MKVKNYNFNLMTARASKTLHKATLTAFVCLLFGGGAWGQTVLEWRSEAANGNWFAPTHWWNGSSAVTAEFGIMRFSNNVHLSMTNNYGGSTFNTHALHFNTNNTSVRTISGDAIRLFDFNKNNPYIRNSSTGTHVLNVNFSGDGDGDDPLMIQLNSTGGFTFNGTFNNQGSVINIEGSRSGSGTNVVFNGAISGSGGLFKTNTNITAVFNAANTFTGLITNAGGTLRLGASGASFGGPTAGVQIGANGTMDLNGFSTTVRYVQEQGTGNGGTVSLGSGTLTIQDNGTGTRFQNSINGSGGNLVYESAASSELSLYNAQGYSGSTTVKSGTLISSGVMQTSSLLLEGGTFRTTGSANRLAQNPNVTLAGGTFNPRTNETVGTLTLTANSTINLSNNNPTLNFAASNAITWTAGATLNIIGWTGTPNQSGSGPRLFFGNSNGGLTPEQLAQISFGGDFVGAVLLSSGEIVPASALPVTMTSFTASCQAGDVQLNWTTASELNASHFTVQMSRDGLVWNTLGDVAAAGTTNQTSNYAFSAKSSSALSYFRLLQVDLDGATEIYGPISSVCNLNKSELSVFPNPVASSEFITIDIRSAEAAAPATIQVMDMMGKVVFSQTMNLEAGTTQIPVNTAKLNSGAYLIHLHTASEKFDVIRFIVE